MKFFQLVENIDYVKLWWLVGIWVVFWGGLSSLTMVWPAFDTPYKVISTFGGAVAAALLFAARGGKYVKDRSELPPQDGKP